MACDTTSGHDAARAAAQLDVSHPERMVRHRHWPLERARTEKSDSSTINFSRIVSVTERLSKRSMTDTGTLIAKYGTGRIMIQLSQAYIM